MKIRHRKGSSVGIATLAFLLSVCITVTSHVVRTEAGNFTATAGDSQMSIKLDIRNPKENIPFQISNMLPGDSKTQYYRLNISYNDRVTVNFRIDTGDGDVKLAEVLQAKVRLVDTDEVLYEGAIDNLSAEHVLVAGESKTKQELCYEITLSLGTNVGNEYQSLRMSSVVLSWWLETSGDDSSAGDGDSEDDDVFSEGVDSGSVVQTPDTGDNTPIMLYLASIIVGMVLFACMILRSRCGMKRKSAMFFTIFLILVFGITTFALVYQKVMVENNFIATASVDISLKDEEPIFDEKLLFEPGMKVKKDITVCNNGTCDAYYCVYFENVTGDLANDLIGMIMDGEQILYRGTLTELEEKKNGGADGLLAEGEERNLSIIMYLSEECKNTAQNNMVTFDVRVDAVQAANNPEGLFK